jgi:hypothetical protein
MKAEVRLGEYSQMKVFLALAASRNIRHPCFKNDVFSPLRRPFENERVIKLIKIQYLMYC